MAASVVARRWGGLGLSLLVLAGLVAYLELVERPREEAGEDISSRAERLLSIDPAGATALTLAGDGTAIRLEQGSDGTWRISAPVATPADQTEVRTLLTSLATARRSRVIDESPADLAAFGLASPPVALTVTVGGADHRIEFGDNSPTGSSVYARVLMGAGDPARAGTAALPPPVLLVPSWVKEAMNKRLFDLRKKELLDLSGSDIAGIELRWASGRERPIALARATPSEVWRLIAPVQAAADQAVVGELVGSLTALRATAIVDEGKAERLAGLKAPRLAVMVSTHDRSARVNFYFPFGEESAYAVTAPEAPLYQVDRQAVLLLEKNLFDLRDKRVTPLAPDAIERIEVAGPAGSYRLNRRDSGWLFDGRPLSPEGGERITAFLKLLNDAKVEKVAGQTPAAWPQLGLDAAATLITLTGRVEGATSPFVVRFGKIDGELLYLRRGDEPESYVAASAIHKAIFKVQELQGFLSNSTGHPGAAPAKGNGVP